MTQLYHQKFLLHYSHLGKKFNLPITLNKKLAIHETIKDIECIKSKNLSKFVFKIRNTIIPRFHNVLHKNYKKNPIKEKNKKQKCKLYKIISKKQSKYYIYSSKGNVTVILSKDFYTQKSEELLDKHTHSVVMKNPEKTIEKKG